MSGARHWEQDKEATVYIGNLDERVTDSLVWELMLQAGRIVNVHLPKDRVTQTHQGYGFVEFVSEEDAEYAAKIMNQVRLYGKPIRVNKASADKLKTVEVGAELFVGNLDPMVTEQVLYDTFSRFGTLISMPKVARDDNALSKGYGFVSFSAFEASDDAIANMNGQFLMNKEISVQYAYKKDGKGERHGDQAERMLAAQARKHNVQPANVMPHPPPSAASIPPPTAAAAAAAAAAAGQAAPIPPTGVPPSLATGAAPVPGTIPPVPPPAGFPGPAPTAPLAMAAGGYGAGRGATPAAAAAGAPLIPPYANTNPAMHPMHHHPRAHFHHPHPHPHPHHQHPNIHPHPYPHAHHPPPRPVGPPTAPMGLPARPPPSQGGYGGPQAQGAGASPPPPPPGFGTLGDSSRYPAAAAAPPPGGGPGAVPPPPPPPGFQQAAPPYARGGR